jgi:hypothetical protein
MRLRPRFSLRWLLIGFTVFAIALYVLFVHPSVAASRFVAAVNRGEFNRLEALGMLKDLKSYDEEFSFETVIVRAESKPRSWRDLYKCRRKVSVKIAFPKGKRKGRESGLVNYVTVHISGPKWGDEP